VRSRSTKTAWPTEALAAAWCPSSNGEAATTAMLPWPPPSAGPGHGPSWSDATGVRPAPGVLDRRGVERGPERRRRFRDSRAQALPSGMGRNGRPVARRTLLEPLGPYAPGRQGGAILLL
jgi:hypothetical protein